MRRWGRLPLDLGIPSVLEGLGENLLRACPVSGVLFTAGDADFYAAWYMRFARSLRPDLLVVPFSVWRSDAVLRGRVAADLKLGHRSGSADALLGELAQRRPACMSVECESSPRTRALLTGR